MQCKTGCLPRHNKANRDCCIILVLGDISALDAFGVPCAGVLELLQFMRNAEHSLVK